MSRRKPIAALAAVATALAVALPASASAATTTVPTIPPITFGIGAGYLQSVVCPILVSQLQLAEARLGVQAPEPGLLGQPDGRTDPHPEPH
jgi:ABC-type sugar transport system substrate-binding protein